MAHFQFQVLTSAVMTAMCFWKSLFLFVTYLQLCYGSNDTVCTGNRPCICRTSRTLKVDINCHGKSLNISTICRICSKIGHVQVLDVGDNGMSRVPASCFGQCTELEDLFLDSNNLTDITKDAFMGLESLKYLNMNNNSLIKDGEIHDPELFKPLGLLEELHIQKNIKTSKPGKTYLSNVANNTLVNLRVLFLDGLPRGRFGTNFINFKHLLNVSLFGSSIFNITHDTFKNIPQIEALDMSYCNLTHIEPKSFEPLKILKFLNLSNNMGLGFPTLRNISYGLRDSQSIETLDYSKVYKTFGPTTQLNRCDVWYFQNTTLKKMYINSNRIATCELDVVRLFPSTLETLFIEDNKLSFGPSVLQGGCLPNLKRLELSRQDFAHPMDIFSYEMEIVENKKDSSGGCSVEQYSPMPGCWTYKHKPLRIRDFHLPYHLETIGFSLSSLRYQPSRLKEPLYLKNGVKTLDMSNNFLYKWTDPLVYTGHLKLLNLSNNFCFNITGDFFTNWPNLETFDASHNKIGPVLENDIEGSIFERTISLRILNISACWIERLPQKAFINLRSLEHLDLSYNMLENLGFRFEHMKNLSTLCLRQNKISTLPLNLLEQMKNLNETLGKSISIDLSNNILDAAECNHLVFISWIIQHQIYFKNIDTYRFRIADHAPVTIQELKKVFKDLQKRCQTYAGLIILATVFIMSMIALIIGGVVYRYRWRLRYLYYMAKAKYRGYIPIHNVANEIEYEYDVFISYATDDYQFVTGEMYNRLKEAGLSMCLHQKDFLPGHDIAGNILQAVRKSRLTLVVLSPAFLESKWCIYEFNMARMEEIYSREGENVIYVLMYQPIDMTVVSPEMRECFESESYSQYPEADEERPYFWQMLVRALGGQTDVLY